MPRVFGFGQTCLVHPGCHAITSSESGANDVLSS